MLHPHALARSHLHIHTHTCRETQPNPLTPHIRTQTNKHICHHHAHNFMHNIPTFMNNGHLLLSIDKYKIQVYFCLKTYNILCLLHFYVYWRCCKKVLCLLAFLCLLAKCYTFTVGRKLSNFYVYWRNMLHMLAFYAFLRLLAKCCTFTGDFYVYWRFYVYWLYRGELPPTQHLQHGIVFPF